MTEHIPYGGKTGLRADFRIRYRFYSPEEGGKDTVRRQGYSPTFWYGDIQPGATYIILPEFEDVDGNVILNKEDALSPNGTARMWIVFPETRAHHIANIHVGLKCFIMEGRNKVAECEVIEILDLERNPRGEVPKVPPSAILQNTAHRSHPLPTKNWQWYQEWNDVVFIHGSADVELLRPFVPPHLAIDTFGGKAWISLVIFKMENIHHRYTPSFPPLSDFHEVNIRTYVTDGEMPGVYFLSMEASKRLSAFLAKKLSGLPYWYEPMECKNGIFRSEHYSYEYKPGADIARNELADWLTERYAVYFIRKGTLARYQVHHCRWPLKEVAIENLVINTSLHSDLVKWKPELFHYSPGVQVLTFPVEKL